MNMLVMKLGTHFTEARPVETDFFSCGLLVSFLGPSMVVTMWAVKNCQPSHPDPNTLH